jgi:hypothetical protein
MEIITPPRAVVLARLFIPVTFYEHRIHCVYIEVEGRFTAIQCPSILDAQGQSLPLHAEIAVGSLIRLHAIDRTLRTVQVLRQHVVNPFASAA